MNCYKNKYIKYKTKYLQIKRQIGGTLEELQSKMTYTDVKCTNPGDIFHQHEGECWSDSMQMLLCFSDELKSSVQTKLFNLTPKEIIEMAYLQNREKYLAPIYRRNSAEPTLNDKAIKMEKRLEHYLDLLQKRLCIHFDDITDIPQCRHITPDAYFCPIKETYGKYLITRETPNYPYEQPDLTEEDIHRITSLKLKSQRSEITGIGTAMKALKLINKKTTSIDHGANTTEQNIIFNILSFCLLDQDNVLNTKISSPYSLSLEDIEQSLGMIVGTPGHATCFYICDTSLIYYNDNLGKLRFNWKKILKKYLDYKNTHDLILSAIDSKYVAIFKEKTSDNCILINKKGEIKKTELNIAEFDKNINPEKDISVSWQDGLVDLFLIVKKENFKNKTEEEIYQEFKNQFLLTDIYNCSFTHPNKFEDFVQVYFDGYPNNCDYSFFKKILSQEFKLTSEHKIKNLFYMLKKCGEEASYRFLSIIDFDKIDAFQTNIILNFCIQHIFNNAKFNEEFVKVVDDLALKFTDINYFELYDLLKIALENNDIEKINFLVEKKYKNETMFEIIIFNFTTNLYSPEDYDYKDIEFIKQLICLKIDLNEPFSNFKYPLVYLLESYFVDKLYPIIKLFIISGANLKIKSSDGESLLELAVKIKNFDIVELLVNYGADVDKLDSDKLYDIIKLYLASSTDLKTKSLGGKSLLELAIKINNVESVELLLKHGIDVNQLDSDKNTQLTKLLDRDYLNKNQKKIAKLLLEAGTNVKVKNIYGDNAIDIVEGSHKSDDELMEIFREFVTNTE